MEASETLYKEFMEGPEKIQLNVEQLNEMPKHLKEIVKMFGKTLDKTTIKGFREKTSLHVLEPVLNCFMKMMEKFNLVHCSMEQTAGVTHPLLCRTL